LVLGPNGLGRECEPDEVGLLLVRAHPADSMVGVPLRGVFEPGDAWRSTGDLFLRDENGELWLVDPVTAIVDTANGPVLPAGARMVLNTVPSVDLHVSYGVREGDAQVLASALTLCAGGDLDADVLNLAFERLPVSHRPSYVQVVPSIPVTTWHRPVWHALQKAGVPKPGRGKRVWRLGANGSYAEL
jgi:putative long chain acyl-CoA synthase